MELGVNIDHVATLREARRTFEPDPVKAALQSENAGCDAIVCHLRKDRRHINDEDVKELKKVVRTKLNLEMSLDEEIVSIALDILPDQVTLVPENRQEITTEGGLDVSRNWARVKKVVSLLQAKGIAVSLFIDPESSQIDSVLRTSADIIEFHTGDYSEAFNADMDWGEKLKLLEEMTEYALSKDLVVCAGHGLNYDNVGQVAKIKGIRELNIGHSIISNSVFWGIYDSVRKMKELIE